MLVEESHKVEESAQQVRPVLCATHACPTEVLLILFAVNIRQVSHERTSGDRTGWRAALLDA